MPEEMEILLALLVRETIECPMAEAPDPEKALADLMKEIGLEYPAEE